MVGLTGTTRPRTTGEPPPTAVALIGLIRAVSGSLEARVLRHATGPTPGPDPEQAHGPQVFEDVSAAIAYVDGNVRRG